ncbi:sterol desaturase family protein [Chondromyces apiculatus]|uniref:Fatty acid hydroxylase domain-containing protein n=1 Tax=Chondromyces apiculatus DSM 436 TaxID=1192034 RepID=A0A017T2L4_9BACT|nr:sterol desaturase family protein [Chondromyces apiculatus]EYF03499.1 Hypothetical protein CAP_5483 [Chondromyces apiculatus DSM 436]
MTSAAHLAWATLTSLAVLALVFVPLERAFPARPGQRLRRPAIAVDLCFFLGQRLVFAALVTAALTTVAGALDLQALARLRASVDAWPLALQALAALVLGDLVVYWFHRACHRVDLLWRFHAVHHSVEHLDWLAAHREHPLDGFLTQLCLNLPGVVLGLPFEAMGALVVLRSLWAIFIHANVRLPLGPLRWILGAPELHHWHHARVERTAHNFANLAPYLDRIFGTYHCPEDPETYPLGLTEPWPRGYLAQLAHPFLPQGRARDLAAHPQSCFTSVATARSTSGCCPTGTSRNVSASPISALPNARTTQLAAPNSIACIPTITPRGNVASVTSASLCAPGPSAFRTSAMRPRCATVGVAPPLTTRLRARGVPW